MSSQAEKFDQNYFPRDAFGKGLGDWLVFQVFLWIYL